MKTLRKKNSEREEGKSGLTIKGMRAGKKTRTKRTRRLLTKIIGCFSLHVSHPFLSCRKDREKSLHILYLLFSSPYLPQDEEDERDEETYTCLYMSTNDNVQEAEVLLILSHTLILILPYSTRRPPSLLDSSRHHLKLIISVVEETLHPFSFKRHATSCRTYSFLHSTSLQFLSITSLWVYQEDYYWRTTPSAPNPFDQSIHPCLLAIPYSMSRITLR